MKKVSVPTEDLDQADDPDRNSAITDAGTFYTFMQGNGTGLVICVHGIGSFGEHFDYLANALKNTGMSVLTYDLLGRGASAYPENNRFDGDAHVKQLRDLITYLELNKGERYHIVAHSMGGAIASLYAAEYADEIQSLVLLSPAGLMDLGPLAMVRGCCSCFQGIIKNIISSGQEKAWREDFVSHEGKSLEIENAMIDKLHAANRKNPLMFNAFWQSALQFPLSGLDIAVNSIANKKHISFLVMWGLLDTAVPYNPNFTRWQNILGDSIHSSSNNRIINYVSYENMGHGFFLEHQDAVHGAIIQFYHDVVSVSEIREASASCRV